MFLNMGKAIRIAGAGLRVPLRRNRPVMKSGRRFMVAGPPGMVRRVPEDSGMGVLLKLKDSLEELE